MRPTATSADTIDSTTGSRTRRDCMPDSLATRVSLASWAAALSAFHLTTDLSADNSRIRSTPSSVSFCTTSSGRPDLMRAKPTDTSRDGGGTSTTSPHGSSPAPKRAARQRPAVSHTVRGSPSRRRRTLDR